MFKKTALTLILIFAVSVCYAGKAVPSSGSVSVRKLTIYAKPDSTSDIKGLLGSGSSVKIISLKKGWYKIQLLGGDTGYVKAVGVSTSKKQDKKDSKDKQDPKDKKESSDKKESKKDTQKDGTARGEVKNMLEKFNAAVIDSEFADSKKIVPSMNLSEVKSDSDFVFLYSASDLSGKKIPSLLKNPLSKNMRELIELSFLKMLKYKAAEYTITVDTPYFGEGGKVNGSVHYAVFKIKASDSDIKMLQEGKISAWSLIKSSRKLGDLFTAYPH